MIEDDAGRVLLVQRGNDPYRGWWTLPTGFVEYGEDAAETAAREVLEETGLLVHVTGCRGIYFGAGDPRGASHVAVFTAERVSGTLTAGDDAADAQWFGADDVPLEIAFEGHRKAIARWQKEHGIREPGLLYFAGGGPASPLLIYAVIENPAGSTERIVYDGRLSSFRRTGEVFPHPLPVHYGWMPRTSSAADGDELDVIVVGEGPAAVGSVVPVRTLGALIRANGDDKVVAVRVDLPSAHTDASDLRELPELRGLLQKLFHDRGGVERWASASEARALILQAQRAWIERETESG
jgi:8-oxo-dGTP diphosphatase